MESSTVPDFGPFDLDTVKIAPYWATRELPYKAATNEIIHERTLDSCMVQITEINSLESVFVTPYPWQPRDMLQTDINKFYLSSEARTWTVNTTELVRTGSVMVARWIDNQFYRVLIRYHFN